MATLSEPDTNLESLKPFLLFSQACLRLRGSQDLPVFLRQPLAERPCQHLGLGCILTSLSSNH